LNNLYFNIYNKTI